MSDVLVVGSSLPALVAALECAEVGLSVKIIMLADEQYASPAEFAGEHDPDAVVTACINRIVTPVSEGVSSSDSASVDVEHGAASLQQQNTAHVLSWLPAETLLQDRLGNWAALVQPSTLGIPAVPLAERTIRLIGGRAAFRAYQDRVLPVLTVGKTQWLGDLVRKRIGKTATEQLVEPIVQERFGVESGNVEVAIAAPGLNEALSRVGSLTGGVLSYADRNVARETRVVPTGGWNNLVAELLSRLRLYNVELIEINSWNDLSVRAEHQPVAGASGDANRADQVKPRWHIALAGGKDFTTRSVIVDADQASNLYTHFSSHLALAQNLDQIPKRVYAELQIEPPAWLAAGQEAIASVGGFSIRAEWPEKLAPRVIVSCPATTQPLVPHLPQLEQVLVKLHLLPAEGASWNVRTVSAPFSSRIEREEILVQNEIAQQEHPHVVVVGRAVHGDELGSALTAASAAMVPLRRALLGLAP